MGQTQLNDLLIDALFSVSARLDECGTLVCFRLTSRVSLFRNTVANLGEICGSRPLFLGGHTSFNYILL